VRDLIDAWRNIDERRLVECYHDATTARDQALQMFNLGLLSLEIRGLTERLYWASCSRIRDICRRLERVPEELEDLENVLSDTYFCNFSLFQSLPDSWAIDQLFPIMPIHRLASCPRAKRCWPTSPATRTARSTASSARATSSARWNCTNRSPARTTTSAPSWSAPTRRRSATCTTCSATPRRAHQAAPEGGWWIEEIVKGDTANRVLEYMEYDVAELSRPRAGARLLKRAVRR
jgi:arginine decarboxylase